MILDPVERKTAEWFLSMFEPATVRQGRSRFASGDLGSIHLTRNGLREALPVQPFLSVAPSVELTVSDGQWDASCSCGRYRCEHSFASILAVLDRAGGRPAIARESELPLSRELSEKLGRALNARETRFLKNLAQLHAKALSGVLAREDLQGIVEYFWHFQNLDEIIQNAQKDPLPFWNSIVLFLQEHHSPVPKLMAPLTDWDAIHGMLREKHRHAEIQRWKSALSQIRPGGKKEQPGIIDFAVQIAGGSVRLLVRNNPQTPFTWISQTQWAKLKASLRSGTRVEPASLPFVTAFQGPSLSYDPTLRSLDDGAVLTLLSHAFRTPELRSRLLGPNHLPIPDAKETLEWQISDAGVDYMLRLRLSNGKKAPNFMAVLEGDPSLYLTESAVYYGPAKLEVLPGDSQVIPAPVIESNAGLRLLDTLKVQLPERVEKQTRRVTLDMVIRGHVGPAAGSKSEYCFIQFIGGAPEIPSIEIYSPAGWVPAPASNASNETEVLYIADRSRIEPVWELVGGLGLSWDGSAGSWRVRVTHKFPELFLAWYATVPREFRFELDWELASLVRDPVRGRVQIECSDAGMDWFDLKTTVNVDDATLTPEEIRLLLNARGKPVRLSGKGWRRLEYELSDEENQCLSRLGLGAHDFSAETQRFHALQLADRAAEKLLAASQYQRIRDRASQIKTRVTPEIPGSITAALRPYQTEGFHFLSYLSENNFGGILADDMGLGKTVQTLTWLEWLRRQATPPRPSLVICPKSVMENWAGEARKFSPAMRVRIGRGMRGNELAKAAAKTDLLVLNYAQLRSLSDAAAKVDWQAVILDEAQYIKNPDSQTSQAARGLRAAHRLALSGTPIENHLLDLWSLMAFVMPGILGHRAEFKRRFDQQNDPFARRRLAARVRPFLLRRTKQQVASELPDRVEEDLVCELEGAQEKLYRAEFKRAQQLLLQVKTQKELNEFRFNFLTSLLRLRQICCHPALVSPDYQNEESAKLNALVDLLEPLMEEGHKVLVFSQFVEMLQVIRTRVKEEKWAYYYLDGSTEERGKLVEQFQKHQGSAVFLISLKAGGFGLNLTAASYVVLYDPWWNPAVENQAIDRTHRIGQSQKVMAYRLLAKNSIEEKIRALQKKKGALAENVLGDEAFASALTLDDFRFLLHDDSADASECAAA